jgi:SAM-dependent methyltransferase
MALISKLKTTIKKVLMPFHSSPRDVLQENISAELERALLLEQSDFPECVCLPENYGKGMPERVVELLFARLSYHSNLHVLDVGHANAMKCHLNMLRTLPQPRHLIGIDIAHPVYDTRLFYEHSVLGDMTKSSFKDATFDLIWCISALEHFGMDNSGYTGSFKRERHMDILALMEMLRLLVSGGELLVTVPYGKYEDHGWLRNYDRNVWQGLLDVAREVSVVKEWYYRHTFGDGWSAVNPEELQFVGYYDQANAGTGGLAGAYFTKK